MSILTVFRGILPQEKGERFPHDGCFSCRDFPEDDSGSYHLYIQQGERAGERAVNHSFG